ncbi:MAG: hypothetical protein EP298_03705 [Gammaproteobacteria bacterium]|nr:MAG: hypothetical protein EP298_03705 [Gammaproteobacteria bacterium]UTW43736.1 hypothetical protein KFE69_06510 [bacterium SCSIO 12844]
MFDELKDSVVINVENQEYAVVLSEEFEECLALLEGIKERIKKLEGNESINLKILDHLRDYLENEFRIQNGELNQKTIDFFNRQLDSVINPHIRKLKEFDETEVYSNINDGIQLAIAENKNKKIMLEHLQANLTSLYEDKKSPAKNKEEQYLNYFFQAVRIASHSNHPLEFRTTPFGKTDNPMNTLEFKAAEKNFLNVKILLGVNDKDWNTVLYKKPDTKAFLNLEIETYRQKVNNKVDVPHLFVGFESPDEYVDSLHLK